MWPGRLMDLTTLLLLLVFALVGGLIYLTLKCSYLEVQAGEAQQAARDAYNKARAEAQKWAEVQTQTLLGQWKLAEEKRIREDAVKRSKAVTYGQVAEQLVPFLPDFAHNPKDARFLGSPIDLVVFDGLSEGTLRKIVFIEVKTGKTGRLSARERQIKQVVEDLEVEFEIVHRR